MKVFSQQKSRLEFEYFLSSADDELRTDYYTGLNIVLKKYGVDGIILNTANSLSSENTIIILAKNDFGESVGGIRIEIKTDVNPLPLEKISTHYKLLVAEKIKKIYNNGLCIAELSGLWANSEIRNRTSTGPLAPKLIKKAFEICDDLFIDILTASPPSHTVDIFRTLGFTPDTDIPSFAYPDDRYITTLMWKNTAKNHKQTQKYSELSL